MRRSLKAQSSRSGRLLYIPFGLVGIASVIVLLVMQTGLAGAIAGIVLVGLSSFVTICLVKQHPEPTVVMGTVPPNPGWLELLNAGVRVWMDVTGQTPHSPTIPDAPALTPSQRAIAQLEAVPGMTIADFCDFDKSRPFARLRDGTVVNLWTNSVGVEHVFLADYNDQVIYGGFVGWIHTGGLQQTIAQIKRELT